MIYNFGMRGGGETQGERGRAAARRRSSEYGWSIVTGYEEIKKPWIAFKANVYTRCIYN